MVGRVAAVISTSGISDDGVILRERPQRLSHRCLVAPKRSELRERRFDSGGNGCRGIELAGHQCPAVFFESGERNLVVTQQIRLQFRSDQRIVCSFNQQAGSELPLNGERPGVVGRRSCCFLSLPPRNSLAVCEGRADERRQLIGRRSVLEPADRVDSVPIEARRQGEAELVGGSRHGGDCAVRTRVVSADYCLLVHAVSKSDPRTKCLKVAVGQSARPLPAFACSGVDERAQDVPRSGIWRGGRKIAPLIVCLNRRQLSFPADSHIDRHLVVQAVVVLKVPGEIWPLLADKPHRVNLLIVHASKKERCEGISARGAEITIVRYAGCRE